MPGGLRFNKGKRRVDLLDVEALNGVAEVLSAGATKYAERNWEQGMPWSKAYASLLRHSFAFWNGEDLDPESGLPHVDHIACNAMFLQAYWRRNKTEDDRPRRGSTPAGAEGGGEEGVATPLPNSDPDPQEEPLGVYQIANYESSSQRRFPSDWRQAWDQRIAGMGMDERSYVERLLGVPGQRGLRSEQETMV